MPINPPPSDTHPDNIPTSTLQPQCYDESLLSGSPNHPPGPGLPRHVPVSHTHVPTPPSNVSVPTSPRQTTTIAQANPTQYPILLSQPSVEAPVSASPPTVCTPSNYRTGQTSSLNPTAAPFISLDLNVNPPLAGTSGSQKTAGKSKQKKAPNKGTESLALEHARFEVNVTKTKLRELEVKNKDLEFKNKILEARVADLESKQKQDIYNRYFPMPDTDTLPRQSNQPEPDNPPVSRPRPSSCSHHTHCCSHQTQYCHGYHAPPHTPHPTAGAPGSNVDDKLDNLKKDVDDMKCKLDVLTDVSIPKMIRDALSSGLISENSSVAEKPTKIHTDKNGVNNNDQEVHDESQHTIDDDIHEISVDLN